MPGIDGLAGRYLRLADWIIARIPYKRILVWKEFFLDPAATVRKDRASIRLRMKDVLVSALIGGAIWLAASLPAVIIYGTITAGAGLLLSGVLLALRAAGIALSPLTAFLCSLLQLMAARLLGGTGSMEANFNASALPRLGTRAIALPLRLAGIPVAWASSIPFLDICMLAVNIPMMAVDAAIWLYEQYLCYLAMREVHGLGAWRAAVVVISPILVALAFLAVAAGALAFVVIGNYQGLGLALPAALG